MKPKLNKKDQAEQRKIRDNLATGQSLVCLFGGIKDKSRLEKNKERLAASNNDSSKMIKLHLAGVALPPWHVVQNGETLESIAANYRVSVKRLIKLNKLSDEQAADLKVGQKIHIY